MTKRGSRSPFLCLRYSTREDPRKSRRLAGGTVGRSGDCGVVSDAVAHAGNMEEGEVTVGDALVVDIHGDGLILLRGPDPNVLAQAIHCQFG